MKQAAFGHTLGFRFLLVAMVAALAALQTMGTVPPASAQGTATIGVTNIDAGSGLPAPFTRFHVTSENGTVYGPLETDLNGYVAFSVTVDPQGTSFTVEEETPPACATAPEPQTTDPLQAGDSAALSFSTQDSPGCGLGTIALYAMACPEGFSGPADDYGPWRDGCTGANDGTGFTLTSTATGESWNPVAGGYGIPGRAPVNGLPAGEYTFQQNGEMPSAVFCLIYDTANYATSPEPSSVEPVALTNGVGTISLTGNRVTCDVFTLPGGAVAPAAPTQTAEVIEPASGASLEVHAAQCPPGYLAGETIYDDCHGNGVDGLPVRVSSDNGFSGTIATTVPVAPGPGIARFDGLPDGTYTVSADTPDESAVFVYCTDASDVQVPATFDDTTQSLALDLASGDVITCDWYEIPAEVQPAAGNSSLELHAVECPAGTDSSESLYDLCHGNGVAGVTFSVGGPDGYAGQQATSVPASPGPGVATFTDLFEGNYTISQEAVEPTTSLVVYCSLSDADDVAPFEYVDADTVRLDLPADTGVVCDWYAIPAADAATTLQVTSYRCVFNMVADESTPIGVFRDSCQPSTGATQFTLTPDGAESVTLTTGSAGVGTVLFESLPTNSYELQSSIPGDFNDAYIFCGLDGGQLPYTGHNSVSLDIDANQGPYLCEWFNVPYNASGYSDKLTVTSYFCPPGTTSNYADRCASSSLSGSTLLLDRNGWDELAAVTDANGIASFERLLPGNYRLTNLPPAGTNVAVYVASCVADGQPFEFTYDDQQSMSILLDLPGGVNVDCNWYNVPPGSPTVTPAGGGSITVYKFLCQGKSINAYNWETDCSAESTPVGFSLKTADDRPIAAGTTNLSGVLTFTNLANGAYSLDETSGDWCHAEGDRVDSAGNVLIENGGNTDVYIYNCSLKQVGALPSTGTGVQTAERSTGLGGERLWQLLAGAMATLGIALVLRSRLQQLALRSVEPVDEPSQPVPGDEPAS